MLVVPRKICRLGSSAGSVVEYVIDFINIVFVTYKGCSKEKGRASVLEHIISVVFNIADL